jgi:hypothetical protein
MPPRAGGYPANRPTVDVGAPNHALAFSFRSPFSPSLAPITVKSVWVPPYQPRPTSVMHAHRKDTFFDEFEEDVGLLGFYIGISQLVNAEHVHVGEHFE